ncbi:MAG: ABC transporter ATP-binding protein [Candidatus Bathyarchaeia archaeon]
MSRHRRGHSGDPEKQPELDWGTMKRALGYITGYWQTNLVLAIIIITTFMEVLSPAIIGVIIDFVRNIALETQIEPGGGIERLAYNLLLPVVDWLSPLTSWTRDQVGLAVFSSSLILIAGLTGLLNYLQRYISTFMSQRGAFEIRSDLYNSLLEQSFSFYDKQRTGQLMARATGDISHVERFFNFGLRMVVNSILLIILVSYSLVSIDAVLTGLSVLTLPFMIYTVRKFATTISPMWGEVRQQYGDITSIIQENLTGLRVVHGFNNQAYEEEKFERECDEYFNLNVKMARLRAFYMPLASFISSIGFIIIIWYGGIQVPKGLLTIGSLVAFYFYLARLMGPVRRLGFMTSMVVRMSAAAERVFEIIDAEVEVSDRSNAEELTDIDGEVVFEDVWFSYDGENYVLKDINMRVSPGETVAILGATGSGKSSIINLIPRFYDVSRGQIWIDGKDVRGVTIKSLRRHIGIVRQDPFLFNMTIRENIAYGVKDASMEDIKRAAKQAKIHGFIESQPNGYDTIVGERGVTLSGGQKQRVAIARALLKNPKLLILDDSTSSVDTQTEYEIQMALNQLLEDRTTFIITQRLSSIKRADYIMVLQDGEIVEEGTHDELMSLDGIYRQLYETQIAEHSEEEV